MFKVLKKVLKFFGVIVLFFIIIIDFIFLIELKKNGGNASKAVAGVLKNVATNATNSEPIYVLLLGQNKDLGQNLTDTIMCLGYDPKNQEAFIVSIPRDTFVGKNIYDAKPKDRINCVYNEKHPEKILSKINEITNLNIKYYVVIDNKSLIKLVDVLGGVEFDVPIDMDYDDKTQNLHIHIKKGLQMIDGKTAEQLLRFRHNNNGTSYPQEYGDNDLGRMKTGRDFILAICKQVLNVRTIDEIKEIIEFGFDNIKTNIALEDIISYSILAMDFDPEKLRLEQLPGDSVYTNGVWVFKLNESECNKLLEELKF